MEKFEKINLQDIHIKDTIIVQAQPQSDFLTPYRKNRQKNVVGKNFGHFEKFGHFFPDSTFDPIVFRGLIRQKN